MSDETPAEGYDAWGWPSDHHWPGEYGRMFCGDCEVWCSPTAPCECCNAPKDRS